MSDDIYYLKSILNHLREMRRFLDKQPLSMRPAIAMEVLWDNTDWLDCYISRLQQLPKQEAAE